MTALMRTFGRKHGGVAMQIFTGGNAVNFNGLLAAVILTVLIAILGSIARPRSKSQKRICLALWVLIEICLIVDSLAFRGNGPTANRVATVESLLLTGVALLIGQWISTSRMRTGILRAIFIGLPASMCCGLVVVAVDSPAWLTALGVGAIPASLFSVNALVVYRRMRSYSTGAWVSIAGFVAWAVAWPLKVWLNSGYPALETTQLLWDLPAFFVALGLILMQLEEQVRRAKHQAARNRDLYDQSQCGLSLTSWTGLLVDCNESFVAMTGYASHAEIVGLPAIDFYADPAERQKVVTELLRDGVIRNMKLSLKRKSGELLPVLLNARLSRDGDDHPFEVEGAILDISEHRRLEDLLIWQAQHDSLTGLPNRTTVENRLRESLVRADREGSCVALLCIDLDRFKFINDNYGHETGDEYLRQFTARLSTRVRAADTFGRVGGDEFVVILEDIRSEEDAARVARDLIRSLNTPLDVLGQQLAASISIGIAKYPKDAANLTALLRRADRALYRAKELGRNQYQCYSRYRTAIDDGIELQNYLEAGLKANRFELYYQPQLCPDGRTRVTEALLRFHHPIKGLLSPKDFIAVAEKSGLLHRIGEWVIERACRQLRDWSAQGLTGITVAVNVSAVQFASPGFPATIERILQEHDIPPELLELELTESLLMSEFDDAVAQMHRLKQLGVRIAVDDFGTGYSSLSYLHQLPIDVLKIDRAFVEDITEAQGTFPIVETIVCLAKAFEIETVAEGVETEAQRTILAVLGTERFQGYLFAKPMAAEQMTAFLKRARSVEECNSDRRTA
jgi:diguanylate cyclase (GGDEF)-like protein/PAS domain S-box-containing protein